MEAPPDLVLSIVAREYPGVDRAEFLNTLRLVCSLCAHQTPVIGPWTKTPVVEAAASNDVAFLLHAIAKGCPLTPQALEAAVVASAYATAAKILEFGVPVTPVAAYLAAVAGAFFVLEALGPGLADIPSIGLYAVQMRNAELYHLLYRYGALTEPVITYTVLRGWAEQVEWLLDRSVPVWSDAAVSGAVRTGNPRMLRLMTAHRPDTWNAAAGPKQLLQIPARQRLAASAVLREYGIEPHALLAAAPGVTELDVYQFR